MTLVGQIAPRILDGLSAACALGARLFCLKLAKEVAASPPKYGNFDYFFAPNQPTRSARITHDFKLRHHEQCPPLTVLISVAPPR
jgi:hypothetical protein